MQNQNQIIQTEIKEYEDRFRQRQEHTSGREIERDNAKFYFRSPYGKLSTLTGVNGIAVTVEQAGDKKVNYKELVDFVIKEPRNTLDLTWMDHNDTIVFGSMTQYKRLETLEINIDNLLGSVLPSSRVHSLLKNTVKQEFRKKNLVVHGENAQLNFMQQIKAFRTMLSFNAKDLNMVTLTGFNSVLDKILAGCAKMHGVAVNHQNDKTVVASEMGR